MVIEVDLRVLLGLDVLHFTSWLTNDPIAGLQRGARLANGAVLLGDECDDTTRFRSPVGNRNAGLDPPVVGDLRVHGLPLLLGGTVDDFAAVDDGVVVTEEDLHAAPLGLDEGWQFVAVLHLRDVHQNGALELGSREDGSSDRVVEPYLRNLVGHDCLLSPLQKLRSEVSHKMRLKSLKGLNT